MRRQRGNKKSDRERAWSSHRERYKTRHKRPRQPGKQRRRRLSRVSTWVFHSPRRYSPKSHSAVKKTPAKTARKPIPCHFTKGSRSKSALVTSVLATRIGVKSGSISNGKSSSRMRAC